MAHFGKHLILNCRCDKSKIKDFLVIDRFIRFLVPAIGMKAYGEPLIVHFAAHNPAAGGYSLVQLIETSCITGHFVDATGDAFIDVFSCKPFDNEKVVEAVIEFFNASELDIQEVERGT